MLTTEQVEKLEQALRCGDFDDKASAARAVAESCRQSAISAHQLAPTVISLLQSDIVLGEEARTLLLSAIICCHQSLAISFDDTRNLLVGLACREIDSDDYFKPETPTLFMCALVDVLADYAGPGETGMLAAIAEKHVNSAVRAAAATGIARIRPSLVNCWQRTLVDQVTSNAVRLRSLKDALFSYADAGMAAQSIFNCLKGQRIESLPNTTLELISFAADDTNCTLRLASLLSILLTVNSSLAPWQKALTAVCEMAVATDLPANLVAEAGQILLYALKELPDDRKHIEDAIAVANQSFLQKFDGAKMDSAGVSKNGQPRLYTDGNGFCLTVNC